MGLPDHPRFFIVIGTQRTGTNLLRDILNTNVQVAMVAEILIPYPDRCHWNEFVPTLPVGWWPPADEAGGTRLLNRYFDYFLNEVRTHWQIRGETAIALGIDLKFDQLQLVEPTNWSRDAAPFFVHYALKHDFVLINTVRDNVVHCMISYLIGMQRNYWHNYDGKTIDRAYTLDVAECLAYARAITEQQSNFERVTHGYPVIRLRYEDLDAAVAATSPGSDLIPSLPALGSIASALGTCGTFHYDGRLQRATNRPYRDIIANHAELLSALRDSEFASWADSIS